MDEPTTYRLEPDRGVYNARRAAALSGVPQSTLHYWARTGIYTPSIAPGPRDRLWSWGDLLALRALDWFRREKGGEGLPRGGMLQLRRALHELDRERLSREDLGRIVAVSRDGSLFLHIAETDVRATPERQAGMPGVLELVRPYHCAPHLLEPRPLLRIRPGKLHGEPHVSETRIPTATLFELAQLGYAIPAIHEMYPAASIAAIGEAIEFEQSLQHPVAA